MAVLYISQESINNNELIYGATGTNEKLAQTFTPGDNITCPSVGMYMGRQTTSPSDSITVRLETTSGGNPTGNLVHANATVTLAAADVPANYGWQLFTFPASISLSASTMYAIVMQRTGTRSTTAYYMNLIYTGDNYAGGTYREQTNGSWGAGSENGDLAFRVYKDEDTSIKDIIGCGIIPFAR